MKYLLAFLLISSPATAAEVCKTETKASFEKHLFNAKFQEDSSCRVFYKDKKQHIACWTDTKSPVGVPLVSVTCKD